MIFQTVLIITARKRSLGQGNIFSRVCQEFCSQGGLPQCILGYHPPPPQEQTTPRDQAPRPDTPLAPGTPRDQVLPRADTTPPAPGTPQDQALPRADTPPAPGTPRTRQTPLGPGKPPCTVHTGRYGQQAGGMHPTGMQSCYV